MAPGWALRPAFRPALPGVVLASFCRRPGRWVGVSCRQLTVDHRNRLTQFWVPPPQVALKDAKEDEESHAKLVRAGFFRQAHSGVFHMLPLGLRVQDKIEALVDKHMRSIGASRVALSSITSTGLWERSGRLESVKPELFQFEDRKEAKFLLAPTHEEEITELVAQSVHSYRGLPLRLYQITRKYRDEMRPRYGILRSREFIMKDLYTFDTTEAAAMETYEQVRGAYGRIFAELKVPVRVARASSGDMGGDLSHEYHLAASLGEDDVASCTECGFAGNTEVVRVKAPDTTTTSEPHRATATRRFRGARAWRGISRDRSLLVSVWYPEAVVDAATGIETALTDDDIDVQAVKEAIASDLDAGRKHKDVVALGSRILAQASAATTEDAAPRPRLVNLVDWRLLRDENSPAPIEARSWPSETATADAAAAAAAAAADVSTAVVGADGRPFSFVRARTGDDCPSCGAAAALRVERAIELGHTFYLGTRYSGPLGVRVQGESSKAATDKPTANTITPLMGCYGIGISRVLGAVADHLADARGLRWPRAIAPFEVVVVAAGGSPLAVVAEGVYDELAAVATEERRPLGSLDVLLDDRPHASLPYKLKDADLTGYPVVVVVGAAWRRSTETEDMRGRGGADIRKADGLSPDGLCEVQCRQLGVRQDVPLCELRTFVSGLLAQL